MMTHEEAMDYVDELLDWGSLSEPPTFNTTLHEGKSTTVVVTFGNQFRCIASTWPTATAQSRAAMFWLLGMLHVAEVELVRLSNEKGARSEALTKVPGLPAEDPAVLAKAVAQVVREMRSKYGIDPLPISKEEVAVYRRCLAIRASGPYTGPDDVRIVCLRELAVGQT